MVPSQMEIAAAVLMAGITFPVSFFLARLCLRGVVKLVTASGQRGLR